MAANDFKLSPEMREGNLLNKDDKARLIRSLLTEKRKEKEKKLEDSEERAKNFRLQQEEEKRRQIKDRKKRDKEKQELMEERRKKKLETDMDRKLHSTTGDNTSASTSTSSGKMHRPHSVIGRRTTYANPTVAYQIRTSAPAEARHAFCSRYRSVSPELFIRSKSVDLNPRKRQQLVEKTSERLSRLSRPNKRADESIAHQSTPPSKPRPTSRTNKTASSTGSSQRVASAKRSKSQSTEKELKRKEKKEMANRKVEEAAAKAANIAARKEQKTKANEEESKRKSLSKGGQKEGTPSKTLENKPTKTKEIKAKQPARSSSTPRDARPKDVQQKENKREEPASKPKPIAKKPPPPSSGSTDAHSSRSAPSASAAASHSGGGSKGSKAAGGAGAAVDDITREPVGADDYKTKLQMQRKLAREKALKDAEEEQQKKELKEKEEIERRRVAEEQKEVERLRREEEEEIRMVENKKLEEERMIKNKEEELIKLKELEEKQENEAKEKEISEAKAKVEAEQRAQVAELKDKERREKSKKEEDERTARKKKLELIMKRVKTSDGDVAKSQDLSEGDSVEDNNTSPLKASSAVNMISGDRLDVASTVKRSHSVNTLPDDTTSFDNSSLKLSHSENDMLGSEETSVTTLSRTDLAEDLREEAGEPSEPHGETEANEEVESGGIFSKMKEFVRKSQENLLSIVSDKPKAESPTTAESKDVVKTAEDNELLEKAMSAVNVLNAEIPDLNSLKLSMSLKTTPDKGTTFDIDLKSTSSDDKGEDKFNNASPIIPDVPESGDQSKGDSSPQTILSSVGDSVSENPADASTLGYKDKPKATESKELQIISSSRLEDSEKQSDTTLSQNSDECNSSFEQQSATKLLQNNDENKASKDHQLTTEPSENLKKHDTSKNKQEVGASETAGNETNESVVETKSQENETVHSQDPPEDETILPPAESATSEKNEEEEGGIFSKMKAFIRKSQENLLSIGSDKPKTSAPTTPEVGDTTILNSQLDDVTGNDAETITDTIEHNLDQSLSDKPQHEIEKDGKDGVETDKGAKSQSGTRVPIRGNTIDVEQSKRGQWDPPQPLTFEPVDSGAGDDAVASSSDTVCPSDDPGLDAPTYDTFQFEEKSRDGASSIDRFDYY